MKNVLRIVRFNPPAQPRPRHPRSIFSRRAFSACAFLRAASRSGVRKSRSRIKTHAKVLAWLGLTIALGAVFMLGQGTEYFDLYKSGASINRNQFASSFFVLTGFHGIHVCVGLLGTLRDDWGMTPMCDQQIGGLLMWVPMCMVYVSTILMQFARWYGTSAQTKISTGDIIKN